MSFKIITFKIYKDPEEWYATSPDSGLVLGYTLDFTAESREALYNTILIEINDLFFNEYDIDFFATEDNRVEILLSKDIPIINNKYVI